VSTSIFINGADGPTAVMKIPKARRLLKGLSANITKHWRI
jgi:hypothetical protein